MFNLFSAPALAVYAGLAALSAPAIAQTFPQKPVMFVVPFAPGGGTDAFARPLAAQLDTQLKMRVLIENRAGAGGTAGASAANKAPPDGHTFFIGAAHHTIAPALYPKLDYDIEKDFQPIGLVAVPPQVIVVNPQKVEAKTLKDLVAFAQKNPGKLNFASAGNGTTHHLAGELFKILTKTEITHVPYSGAGPAMADLVAGHVEMEFDGLGSSAAQITGGKLRALAMAAPKRSASFPDVPTAAEAGVPGFEVSTWYGLWAHKSASPEIVARMTEELKIALKSPLITEAWSKNGSEIPNLYGADFAKFINAEIARWGKVVKDANVRLE